MATIGNWNNKKKNIQKSRKYKKWTHQDLTPFLIGRDCVYVCKSDYVLIVIPSLYSLTILSVSR